MHQSGEICEMCNADRPASQMNSGREALPRPYAHLLLNCKNSEWPVTAMERLSEDKGTNPLSPATLFIAECVQMSIIYADTCKRRCHINNCVIKIVTETSV